MQPGMVMICDLNRKLAPSASAAEDIERFGCTGDPDRI